MTTRRPTLQLLCAVTSVSLSHGAPASPCDAEAQAQESAHVDRASDRPPSSDFVKTVRAATERFKDVAVAEAEGYGLMFGCVSGPDWGAMGLHYVNLALVADGELDPTRPEIVIYEPLPNGRARLIGADFLVFASAWHATNQATPELGRPADAPVREPEPVRPARLLHAARLGLEGQPDGHVLQLALEGVMRRLQREGSVARSPGGGWRKDPIVRLHD